MKAFDAETLQSTLDSDLTWRRKEISALLGLAQVARVAEKPALIRASIPLIYAHWEGFVRNCFLQYFDFVARRRISFDKLSMNFLYLASKSDFPKLVNGSESVSFETFLESLRRASDKNRDPFRRHVNTKSNLRSDVLLGLFVLSGLPYRFQGHDDFIDRELCDSRNEIAHGAGGAPELDVVMKRRDQAFGLMTGIQSEIVNAVLDKKYLALGSST